MPQFLQDLRFSLRLMHKRAGTAALVTAMLMLGIGLNTAVFSVLNAVVLRPLPVPQPDRLVWLSSRLNQTGAQFGTSYPDYLDWKTQSRSFQEMAAQYALSFTLTGDGPAEHVKAAAISASGFRAWGVETALGRDFTGNDDRPGANRFAILNYPFWQKKFGGDRAVLGKPLVLDGLEYTIIGVLQPTPLGALRYPDLFVTIGPLIDQHLLERDTRYFFPVARLKPNVPLAQAQAEMDTIAARLAAQYPATNKDMGVRVRSMVEQLTTDGRKPLPFLMAAAILIFVLAAINVMTLFLAYCMERGPELGTRLALGATHSGLVRQLFIQALTFAFAAGILGVALAKLVLMFFLKEFPAAFLRFQETSIDLRVMSITVALTLLAGIIAALLPAMYAWNLAPATQLTGRWSSFAPQVFRGLGRAAFIVFEVSLAATLSLASGLLIRSFYQVEKVDLGFNPAQVFSLQINPPAARYKDPPQQAALYKSAFEKLSSLPGMHSTSGIASLPLTTQGWLNTVEVDQQSPLFSQKITVEDEAVLPRFFEAMKIPILQGRDFTDADRDGSTPVIIVDDALAAKLWPRQDPIGKRLRMSFLRHEPSRWLEVIGVVKEIRHFGPERDTRWMQVYVPEYQDPSPVLSFVINTSLHESAVKAAAEKSLHELDNDLPVEDFQSMTTYLNTVLSSRKLNLLLLTIFAAIGLLLGMLGIYGVVSDSVVRRQREIAIRMAVGATPYRAIALITRSALLATIVGVLLGSAIIASLARLLASLLFGVTALDAGVYGASAAILILLALLASVTPAMRLLRFNIQQILRQ